MASLSGQDIKPFVGCYNFEGSRDFYLAIGFTLNWEQEDLAELELGDSRVFLQRYYQKDWCNNTMLHITVDDAQAWHERIANVIATQKFASAPGGPRVNEPKEEPYGALVTYVWDPSGNLLHFAEPLNEDRKP